MVTVIIKDACYCVLCGIFCSLLLPRSMQLVLNTHCTYHTPVGVRDGRSKPFLWSVTARGLKKIKKRVRMHIQI